MAQNGGLRKRPGRFVTVPQESVRDDAVSYRALGVLVWVLDRPEGWDIRAEHMAGSAKTVLGHASAREGREAIRTALRELGARGYYRLERRRLRDGKRRGTWVMGTAISPEPITSWAEQWVYFGPRGVPMEEQADGSYLVIYPDGSRLPDDFPPPPVPVEPGADDHADAGAPDVDPDGSGDGFPGPGNPASGKPASGKASPKEGMKRTTEKNYPPPPRDDATGYVADPAEEPEEGAAFAEHQEQAATVLAAVLASAAPRWRHPNGASQRVLCNLIGQRLSEGWPPALLVKALTWRSLSDADDLYGALRWRLKNGLPDEPPPADPRPPAPAPRTPVYRPWCGSPLCDQVTRQQLTPDGAPRYTEQRAPGGQWTVRAPLMCDHCAPVTAG